MPGINQILNQEMRRLARKEAKAMFLPLKTELTAAKKQISELKKRVTQLERAERKLGRVVKKQIGVVAPAGQDDPSASSIRVTGKRIRKLRSKLGLPRHKFAKLIGVSAPSIYLWEQEDGRLQLRDATLKKIGSVLRIGKREALNRLAELDE